MFKIGQSYVAENLCIYSITPEMMCKGSCVLDGVLERNSEASDQERLLLQDDKPIQVVEIQQSDLDLNANRPVDRDQFVDRQILYAFEYTASVPHPPQG